MNGQSRKLINILAAGLVLTVAAQAQAQGQGASQPVFSDPSVELVPVEAFGESGSNLAFEGTGDVASEFGVDLTQPNPDELAKLPVMSADGPVRDGGATEAIIGVDTRMQVYTNTRATRATVLVTFTGGRCTGWLYGKDVVATAGHCVHTGGPGGAWRSNVRVYPGYDNDAAVKAPFGSCTAKWLASVKGWVNSSKQTHDYGAIKLNCTVGNATGWFGYFTTTKSITKLPAIITGYPGDKPFEQWLAAHRVNVSDFRHAYYANDTLGGMSGSAVWFDRTSCNGPCALAIHAYRFNGTKFPKSKFNYGTRINKYVFNNLSKWKAAP